MGLRPCGASAAAALALAGCAASGVLVVHGVVRAEGPGRAEPLAGATVQCREGRDGAPRYARATTEQDGGYRLEYRYDGTWFPLLAPKAGGAWAEFAAPGFQPRLVRLRGGAEPGVSRADSGPYLRLDVTLVPLAGATGAPGGR